MEREPTTNKRPAKQSLITTFPWFNVNPFSVLRFSKNTLRDKVCYLGIYILYGQLLKVNTSVYIVHVKRRLIAYVGIKVYIPYFVWTKEVIVVNHMKMGPTFLIKISFFSSEKFISKVKYYSLKS